MPFVTTGARRSMSARPLSHASSALLSPPLSPSPSKPSFPATPLLDPEMFDTVPFSESFSAILDLAPLRDESFLASPPDTICSSPDVMKGAKRMSYRADASYYVEQLTNIRDLDSEWEDDEVEEVMIISPKTRASTLPRTSSVLSSAMTAAASTPTLATQIPLPPSPHQGAYTVLRTLGRTPTSTLALAVTSQSTAQHSLVVVRACRRPLARRDRTERACLELLSSARAGNVYVQKMLRTWEDGPALYMVFEYCDGGDLLSYLQRKRIEPAIAASWARGIASGLAFVHDMGIIHSAIKPSNILLRASGHVMISGFAHASLAHADPDDTALDLTLTGGLRVDTPATKEWHEAPEVLLGWKIGFEVDVWGYGIVLGWMALGRHPLTADAKEVESGMMRASILQGSTLCSALGQVGPLMQDVIEQCLERNPAKRPDMARVMSSELFEDIDWDHLGQHLGDDIPISVPFPPAASPNALSPEVPKVIVPPPSFASPALASPWCLPASPGCPADADTDADADSLSSASASDHSAPVLARAQRAQLADARPVSLAQSEFAPSAASPPPTRPRNPSPPDARASFLPCLSEADGEDDGEGAVRVADGVSVTEFGRLVCEDDGGGVNVAGIGAGMTKAERALCRRAMDADEDEDKDEEMSMRAALALPIPVLVTPRPERTAGPGRRKLQKTRRSAGGGQRAHSSASVTVGLGIEVPEISWNGLDDDPFRRDSALLDADAERTFRWSALSLDPPPPPVPAHQSTLTARLRSGSRVLLRKSRSSLFRAGEGREVEVGTGAGEECAELGAGVRKMGRGIGYTRGEVSACGGRGEESVYDDGDVGVEAVLRGELAGVHSGACYAGLARRPRKSAGRKAGTSAGCANGEAGVEVGPLGCGEVCA